MNTLRALAALSLTCMIAAPLKADPASSNTLRLTASEWPPYVSPDGPKSGFAPFLVSEALERAGYNVSIDTGPWPETLDATIDGKYDVFATLWHTDERAESIVFSEPYIQNEMVFIRLSDSDIRARKREDLAGLRIGIVADFAYNADADTRGIDIVSSGSVSENMRALRNGELDLVVADRRVALTEINRGAHARSFDVLPEPLLKRGLRIGVSKQREDAEAIVAAFEAEIAKMREDGTFNGILATFRLSDW